MRPARPLALLLLMALLGPAACSDGKNVQAWAVSVCTSLSPWRGEIGSLTDRAQEQMKALTTPGQAKENLMRLFGGAQAASEKARSDVAKAGVPDVDDGQKIADGFVGSLAAMRDAYERARAGIAALPTAPAGAFYEQVGQVVAQLQTDYAASSLDTSKLDSPELKSAFDEVPECR